MTDLYNNFLKYHPVLLQAVENIKPNATADDLVNNDPLAILICRLHYYRYPDVLPDHNDIEGIWRIYKLRYNTPEGAATYDQFIECYRKYGQ